MMRIPTPNVPIERNRSPDFDRPLDADFLNQAAAREVMALLSHCPAYRATPLVALETMARGLDVAQLWVKDESARFSLQSFKALGGMYAVFRLVLAKADATPDELIGPRVRSVAQSMVFACATDGNHGRAVACAARLVGARAVIYLHEGVSEARGAAIAAFGAELRIVKGSYDDSVREVTEACAQHGWTLVSDMSWDGYVEVPRLVMQGYLAMVHEALAQLPQLPTHVFVQAGCGGLAAAVTAHLTLVLGSQRPKFIIAEPRRAACLFESNLAGRRLLIPAGESTVMSMLECYEPSLAAWEILVRVADFFLLLDEEEAVGAMRALAFPQGGDPAIVAGESGATGLAAAMQACAVHREVLEIDGASRLLVFNTEGATDPDLYRALVGVG